MQGMSSQLLLSYLIPITQEIKLKTQEMWGKAVNPTLTSSEPLEVCMLILPTELWILKDHSEQSPRKRSKLGQYELHESKYVVGPALKITTSPISLIWRIIREPQTEIERKITKHETEQSLLPALSSHF